MIARVEGWNRICFLLNTNFLQMNRCECSKCTWDLSTWKAPFSIVSYFVLVMCLILVLGRIYFFRTRSKKKKTCVTLPSLGTQQNSPVKAQKGTGHTWKTHFLYLSIPEQHRSGYLQKKHTYDQVMSEYWHRASSHKLVHGEDSEYLVTKFRKKTAAELLIQLVKTIILAALKIGHTDINLSSIDYGLTFTPHLSHVHYFSHQRTKYIYVRQSHVRLCKWLFANYGVIRIRLPHMEGSCPWQATTDKNTTNFDFDRCTIKKIRFCKENPIDHKKIWSRECCNVCNNLGAL